MTLIKHAIVDTDTNKVVNLIEYETEQVGVPPGFESEAPHLLCVVSGSADIGMDYIDGAFVDNRPKPEPIVYLEIQ
jgi:hypothetical protein